MELTTSLLHALLVACDQSYNRNPIAGQALAPFGDSPTPGTADAPPNSMPPAWQDDLAGWTEDKRFDDPANGFGAVVYKKAASGGKFDYIVATQGTRGLNAQDWQGNLTYGWEKFTASNGGQKLINYLLGTGTDGILTTTNQIHFTGQSMGGALAQYVAYEYVDVRQNVDEDPTFSQANVSLTTFNGLGGVEALSHNYQTDIGGSDPARVFNPALLSGVATAHYYIANDFVSSLGGGHLNGSEYLINLYRPNPLDGASLAYYKPVDAHRIETGFYHGAQVGAIDQGGSGANYDIFANAYLREITQVQIAQAAKAGTLIGNLLNDGNTGPLEAKARLAAAAMIALADGPADDIRNLTQALLDHAHLSGMLTDSAYNHLYPRLDKALRAFAQSSAGQTAAMKALAVAGIVNALGGEGVSQSYADITSAMALLTPQMGGSAADLAITEMGNFNAPFFSAHDGQDRQETELAILDGLLLIAGDPALIPSLALTIVQTYFDDFVDLLKTSNDFQKDMLKFVAQKAIELDIDIGKATVQMAGWLWQQAQDAGNAVYESAAELQAYLDGQAQEIGNALSGVVKAAANGFDELIKKFSDPLFAWGQGVTRRVLDQFNGAFEASFRSGGGIFAGAGASASWGAAEDEIEEAQRIVQGTSQLIVLRPGAGPNPFDDENFDPDAAPVAAGVLRENGAQSFTLYLPYGAGEDGLKVKLQLAGAAAAAFDVYRNGIRIASGAGEFELSLEAGQRSASFTLAALRDIDADETLGLSAQLLDAQGSPTHQSHLELNLAFDATQEPDPVPGGLYLLDDYWYPPLDGVEIDLSTSLNSATVIGTNLNDKIYGSHFSDSLRGGAGDDLIKGIAGDNEIIGGLGADRLIGGTGNDRIYANDVVELTQAIAAAAQAGEAPLAEVLEGGPGDDLMVGGVTNYLYGGGGAGGMVGGGGADIAQGDTWDGGTETAFTELTLHVDFNEAKHKHYFYISEASGGTTTLYARFGRLDPDGQGDTIFTGAGNDTAMGELGDDVIYGNGNRSKLSLWPAGKKSVAGGRRVCSDLTIRLQREGA